MNKECEVKGQMTWEEYYAVLAEEWKKVDKNNLEEIKRYNEFRRQLRKSIDN